MCRSETLFQLRLLIENVKNWKWMLWSKKSLSVFVNCKEHRVLLSPVHIAPRDHVKIIAWATSTLFFSIFRLCKCVYKITDERRHTKKVWKAKTKTQAKLNFTCVSTRAFDQCISSGFLSFCFCCQFVTAHAKQIWQRGKRNNRF